MSLRIYLTGPIQVETATAVIDERRLGGRQGRLAFAMLTWERPHTVSKEELAEALWGEAMPSKWDRALSAVISKLRTAIEGLRPLGVSLESARGGYRLKAPGDTWVDVEAAIASLDEAEGAARTREYRRSWPLAEVAFSVVSRPFLPDVESPWVARKQRELHEFSVRVAECLSEIYERTGQHSLAVAHAERALAAEPFRETAYQLLMRAHFAAGNRAESLRVYARCREVLSDELGVDPSAETVALYMEILQA